MKKPDVSIISSGATLADARLHRIANALTRDGLTVELFAPGSPSDAPDRVTLRNVHQGRGFVWRMHRAFYSPWRANGRIIYCLAPEAQSFTWMAAIVKRRIYCADVYEDYLTLLQDRSWAKRYFGILGRIGSLVAQSGTLITARAKLTTVADAQVPPFNARERIVLRNLPDASHLTPSGQRDATPRAIYIGDVRTSRGLQTMLGAAVLAPNWHFDIVGPISEQDSQWVHQWQANHQEAATRVIFHGRMAPQKSWEFARGAWVGLSLLTPTPAFLAAVPSKLYEYMAVGLATITTSLPRSASLIEESRSGAVADSGPDVAELLNKWERDPELLDQLRQHGLHWASRHLDSGAEYGPLVTQIRKLL